MLLIDIADNIGTVTFDRDHRRNALCEEMVLAFAAALESFRSAGVRCVVLRARAGSKVWSAGHDIDELHTIPTPSKDEIFEDLVKRSQTLANDIKLLTEDQLCEKIEVISPWFQANMERYEYIQHTFNHSTIIVDKL